MNIQESIAKYLQLRDYKDALRKKQKTDMDKVDAVMAKVGAGIHAALLGNSAKSIRTDAGTAYLEEAEYVRVQDWEAVLDFVRERDAWDLLEKRVGKRAAQGYRDDLGAPPPGLGFDTELKVVVRR